MARKPVVETPQYKEPEGPGIAPPSVRSKGIQRTGTPTARGPRIPNTQVPLVGYESIQRGLRELQGGIRTVAKQQGFAMERGRKAGVVEEALEIRKRLDFIQDDLRSRKGSDAIGMTEELIDSQEEIWEDYRGDREMDPDSELELKTKFAGMFMQKVAWSYGREAGQAEQQVKDSKALYLSKAVTETLQVPRGPAGEGLKAIEVIKDEVMRESMYIDPDMSEESYNLESKIVHEKLLAPWVSKQLVHDPAGARKLWKGRSKYFKTNMPLQWEAMNRKMEAAKPDALIDLTIGMLNDKYRLPNGTINYLGAFEEMNEKGFADRYLEGDESGLSAIKQKYLASYTATTNLAESTRLTVENNEITRIYNNPKNRLGSEDGAPLNYEMAIAEVTIAARSGLISGEKAANLIAKWRNPTWLPVDDNRMFAYLADEISDGRTPDDGDILSRLHGDADFKKFKSYVTGAVANRERVVGNVDYVKVAGSMFTNVMAGRSLSVRNRMRAFKETYVQMVRDYMITNKLTKFDVKVFEYADKQLQRVVKTSGGDIIEKGQPGSNTFWQLGEEEGYRFQFPGDEPQETHPPPKSIVGVDPSTVDPRVLKVIQDNNLPLDSETVKDVTDSPELWDTE